MSVFILKNVLRITNYYVLNSAFFYSYCCFMLMFNFYRCNSVVKKYPDYSVDIQGVGDPPPESSSLGCCSQLAIFELNLVKNASSSISDYTEQPYELVSLFVYNFALTFD